MDAKLRNRLQSVLTMVDDHGTRGPRLFDDGQRLWKRVQRFIELGLIPEGVDEPALELACLALQLPMKHSKPTTAKKLARTTLRDRAEEAAELLIQHLKDDVDETLLDRATRLLHEMTQRSPMLDEARLLADAVNLDDFGMIGWVLNSIALGCQGDGAMQMAEGCEKREQYGYWEARLKDGFHFEPVRKMARQRLGHARQAAASLLNELKEDRAS